MKINLRKLIEDRKLDRSHLAVVLFPKAKHPAIALTRLLSGRSKLGEEQIYRLAIYTGLSVDALYTESMHWRMNVHDGLVRFTHGEFISVYSPMTGISKIYHLESLMATHVMSKPNQPINEYLSEINEIVINKSIKS